MKYAVYIRVGNKKQSDNLSKKTKTKTSKTSKTRK